MKRWRRAVVAAGLLVALTGLAPQGVRASDPITTLKACTGDVDVWAYRLGDPGLDEVGSFHMNGTVFCHDTAGRTGYTVKVQTRQGRIQGTGWCADPSATEPGNITMSALVQMEVRYRNERPRWNLLRSFTGRSLSPVPGGDIKGEIRTSPFGVQLGRFKIQPMGSWNDCAYSFQSLRLHDVFLGPAPAG